MKRYILIAVVLLAGCTSSNDFVQGKMHCWHTTSAHVFGTAQVVSCEDGSRIVYANSFGGTAIVEPIEKVVEAGAIIGGMYGLLNSIPRTVHTDNTIHIQP